MPSLSVYYPSLFSSFFFVSLSTRVATVCAGVQENSPRNHLGCRNGAGPGLRCPCHSDESHRAHIKPSLCERDPCWAAPSLLGACSPKNEIHRPKKQKKKERRNKYDCVLHIKADLSPRNWFIGFPDILVVVVMLYLWWNCWSLSLCSPNLFYILL